MFHLVVGKYLNYRVDSDAKIIPSDEASPSVLAGILGVKVASSLC